MEFSREPGSLSALEASREFVALSWLEVSKDELVRGFAIVGVATGPGRWLLPRRGCACIHSLPEIGHLRVSCFTGERRFYPRPGA